jgi:hypothetical protein
VRQLSIALLLGAVLVHSGSRAFAYLFSFPRAGMEHMLYGLGFVILAGCLCFVFLAMIPSIWRNLGLLACAIWVCEGAQMTVCRALIIDPKSVPRGMNMCDFVSGQPFTAAVLTLYALAIVAVVFWSWAWRET